ncbi:MAG: nuclear transport factor 2 family protein [Aeromicrobium sp.]
MTNSALLAQMSLFERCILTRDRVLAETVLDPDYALVLVHPAPAVMPRSRWLDILPEYIVHSWVVQEQTIDVSDSCAAVLQRVDMSATVLGEDRSGLFVISDVWRNHDDDWRLWRRHSTPLSAGNIPGTS